VHGARAAIVLATLGALAGRASAVDEPTLGVAALGGLVWPSCQGQNGDCGGSVSLAPAAQLLLLYQPDRAWAFGLAGQVAHTTWRSTYVGMTDGALHDVSEELTTGFFGVTARYAFLAAHAVTPLVQVAGGSAFQGQSGSNLNCNDKVAPTGEVEVGGLARVSSSLSLYALASASGGVRLGGCGASDGPPVTPFAGWGVGLHLGAAYDLPLGPGARL
jgi:hypothetical protein